MLLKSSARNLSQGGVVSQQDQSLTEVSERCYIVVCRATKSCSGLLHHDLLVRPDLPHEPRRDAVTLRIVLGGKVPAGPDGEVARDPGDPQVVLPLLQGLQDEELVRRDELHHCALRPREEGAISNWGRKRRSTEGSHWRLVQDVCSNPRRGRERGSDNGIRLVML